MPKQVSNVASDDYLTAIYRLHHDEGQDVIAVRLADRLEITPPSVAGMLKRLIRDGLVEVDARKVIHLTPEGLRRAEQMVRRHRLAECLITEILQVPWWRAYDEAHRAGAGAAVFEGVMIDEANRNRAERIAQAGRAAGSE